MKLLEQILRVLVEALDAWRDTRARKQQVADDLIEKEKRDAMARKIDADSYQRTDDFRL